MDEKIEIRECDYCGEHYKVRFDGAVWRFPKKERKNSRFDNIWTKGDIKEFVGYSIADIPTYRIVGKAFLNVGEDDYLKIGFKDGKNNNISVDNLFIKDNKNLGFSSLKEATGCTLTPSEPLFSERPKLTKPLSCSDVEHSDNDYTSHVKITNSLTSNAKQVDWKIPTEFPLCKCVSTMEDYYSNINIGDIFSKNNRGEGLVVKKKWIKIGYIFYVMVFNDAFEFNKWLPTSVKFENGFFLHGNLGAYHTIELADKIIRLRLLHEDIDFTAEEEAFL